MDKSVYLRNQARDQLVRNIHEQSFIPKDGDPAYVCQYGKKIRMPAYVPYIGSQYFAYRPRILCYAINQNLSRHRKWSDEWMNEWAMDVDCAVDRLNRAAESGRAIPVKPYAEGFMPLAALLGLLSYLNGCIQNLPVSIDAVAAVTNFVKFSTSDSASSSEIPESWWAECGRRYARYELEILKPDIIVVFGKKTFYELHQVIRDMDTNAKMAEIFDCRFPGRIPSVKARPMRGREKDMWHQHILPLVSRIDHPEESFVNWRMTRFPGYFVDIARSWNVVRA